jgi:hypothetical protein
VQVSHPKAQLRHWAPVTIFEVYYPSTHFVHSLEDPGDTHSTQLRSQISQDWVPVLGKYPGSQVKMQSPVVVSKK